MYLEQFAFLWIISKLISCKLSSDVCHLLDGEISSSPFFLIMAINNLNPTFAGFQNGAREPGMGHYDPSLISCKNEATEEYEVSKYVV